jgi:hypothetical protein
MENQELLNALMSDPEVRKLLIKLSKNENVNAALTNSYTQGNYYPNNHNNCCPPCNCNQNTGLGGLGFLFLLPLLFCGCGSNFGFGRGCGFGGGYNHGCFNNCCDCCDCCCEFWC